MLIISRRPDHYFASIFGGYDDIGTGGEVVVWATQDYERLRSIRGTEHRLK